MAEAKILRIYLDEAQQKHAESGAFNVMNRIKSAFESCGFQVEFRRNSDHERLKSAKRHGYSLFLMDDPFHPRALCLRRAYFYPFWRLENTAKRWEFTVAQTPFDVSQVDRDVAKDWADKWRKWIFKGAATRPERQGLVYVPLQGRLLNQRSFQTMSPVETIEAVLRYEPERRIVLGLHPNEEYSTAERGWLADLCKVARRVSVQTGGMEQILPICDYVVTQNSSAALSGFFFHKPAILFGQIDFHHIAMNVADLGAEAAFEAVKTAAPAYDAYLHWFLQMMSIKADESDTEAKLLTRVREHGWQI